MDVEVVGSTAEVAAWGIRRFLCAACDGSEAIGPFRPLDMRRFDHMIGVDE
jgi:hypothetical protein